jgi:hypothetical protein
MTRTNTAARLVALALTASALAASPAALAGPGPQDTWQTIHVDVTVPAGERYVSGMYSLPECGQETFLITHISVTPNVNVFQAQPDIGRWFFQAGVLHAEGNTKSIRGLSLAGADEAHASLSLPGGAEPAKVAGYVDATQFVISLRGALLDADQRFGVHIAGGCGTTGWIAPVTSTTPVATRIRAR